MNTAYDSTDLCTIIMRSEYTNSYDNFFYNSFVPIEANNNEEAIQSIKHIKSEIGFIIASSELTKPQKLITLNSGAEIIFAIIE